MAGKHNEYNDGVTTPPWRRREIDEIWPLLLPPPTRISRRFNPAAARREVADADDDVFGGDQAASPFDGVPGCDIFGGGGVAEDPFGDDMQFPEPVHKVIDGCTVCKFVDGKSSNMEKSLPFEEIHPTHCPSSSFGPKYNGQPGSPFCGFIEFIDVIHDAYIMKWFTAVPVVPNGTYLAHNAYQGYGCTVDGETIHKIPGYIEANNHGDVEVRYDMDRLRGMINHMCPENRQSPAFGVHADDHCNVLRHVKALPPREIVAATVEHYHEAVKMLFWFFWRTEEACRAFAETQEGDVQDMVRSECGLLRACMWTMAFNNDGVASRLMQRAIGDVSLRTVPQGECGARFYECTGADDFFPMYTLVDPATDPYRGDRNRTVADFPQPQPPDPESDLESDEDDE